MALPFHFPSALRGNSIHALRNLVKNYVYAVSNGKRIVTNTLHKPLPSHVTNAGHRTLTSYEGQPQTCYSCGETGHMYQVCLKCRGVKPPMTASKGPTWAQRVDAGSSHSDSSEYVTNSITTTAPRFRPSQQSQPNCTGTCIIESGFVSPPEAQGVHYTPQGRMTYWKPKSSPKPLWHYQRSHGKLRTSGQHFQKLNPHFRIP
jgi:hypothetical protein